MQTKTYIVMDYKELEALAAEHLGAQNWESVAAEEWHNDNVYAFEGITGERDSYFDHHLPKLQTGKWGYLKPPVRSVLNKLVRQGNLEPGDYLIDVMW